MSVLTCLLLLCLWTGTGVLLGFMVYAQFAATFAHPVSDRLLLGILTAFFLFLWVRYMMEMVRMLRDRKKSGSHIWSPDHSTRKKEKNQKN